MTDKNLNYILSLFKQMEVSDSFIKGALFVLGGVLLRTNDVRTPAIVERNQ